MKENILEVSIDREINCSANVAWWNTWDHEHLDAVHSGYKKSDILYESKNFLFRVDDIKIPGIPFLTSSNTPLFIVQHDENTQYTFAIQFGVLSPEEIERRSVCEILTHETYDGDMPKMNGLFDCRMGTLDHDKICPIDEQTNNKCPGYFGHIKLAVPVFHIHFFLSLNYLG